MRTRPISLVWPAARPREDGAFLVALLAEAGAAFAILYLFLAGWRRDFRVPLAFDRDALEYLMQVKGTIENGWWWVHPRLSAPGVFEQVQYPSNTTVDQVIVWIVDLFTREPGLVINASWMIMVVLSGVIASRCLALRASRVPGSGCPSVRALAVRLVPEHRPFQPGDLPGSFSLHRRPFAAAGRLGDDASDARWALGALHSGGVELPVLRLLRLFSDSCGFDDGVRRRLEPARIGTRSRVRWRHLPGDARQPGAEPLRVGEQGKPVSIPEKHAAEAEQYGLKIRHLVGPVPDYAFAPFRYWTDREEDARYSFDNENATSRLGIVGTLGFLALLSSLFAPQGPHDCPSRSCS